MNPFQGIREWFGDFFFGHPCLHPSEEAGMERLERALERRIRDVEERQRRIRAEAEVWLQRSD